MIEWQDISTAPKDGTWILIWHRSARSIPRVSVAQFHNEYSEPVDDAAERVSWKNEAGFYQIHATHWMPLPPPPVSP